MAETENHRRSLAQIRQGSVRAFDSHPFGSGAVDSRASQAPGMSRTNSYLRPAASSSNMRLSISSSNLVASSSMARQNFTAQTVAEEARLRGELRFFFMTPCEKWKYRRKAPVKLSIQVLKVVLITFLAILFGSQRAAYVSYMSTLQTSLEHLYLLNWSATYETPPYPPSAGVYSVYSQSDFYNSLDYILSQYNATQSLQTDTFQIFRQNGSLEIAPARFCVSEFAKTFVKASNRTLKVDFNPVVWCEEMRPIEALNQTDNSTYWYFDSRAYLQLKRNASLQFEGVEAARVYLAFVSVKPPGAHFSVESTDCYLLNVTVTFDNSARCGQMPIILSIQPRTIECYGSIKNEARLPHAMGWSVTALVIICSVVSFALCARSLRRGYRLLRETAKHFSETLAQPLTLSDKLEFVNFWYVMVLASDIMAIAGCIMKLKIDTHGSHAYDECSIVLGVTVLLVWIGVLRYLTFFAGYSDLILTLHKAAPSMGRYLLCTITIFLGFILCGWIVIGPYHFKMKTLSSTAECLFALLNGDDMYATFSNLSLDVASGYVNVFLRVYLYAFVTIFIYMALAVFLSVILDVYETVKQKGAVTLRQLHADSDLFKFIYRLDDDDSIAARQAHRNQSRVKAQNEAASRLQQDTASATSGNSNMMQSYERRVLQLRNTFAHDRGCPFFCCCGNQNNDD